MHAPGSTSWPGLRPALAMTAVGTSMQRVLSRRSDGNAVSVGHAAQLAIVGGAQPEIDAPKLTTADRDVLVFSHVSVVLSSIVVSWCVLAFGCSRCLINLAAALVSVVHLHCSASPSCIVFCCRLCGCQSTSFTGSLVAQASRHPSSCTERQHVACWEALAVFPLAGGLTAKDPTERGKPGAPVFAATSLAETSYLCSPADHNASATRT